MTAAERDVLERLAEKLAEAHTIAGAVATELADLRDRAGIPSQLAERDKRLVALLADVAQELGRLTGRPANIRQNEWFDSGTKRGPRR